MLVFFWKKKLWEASLVCFQQCRDGHSSKKALSSRWVLVKKIVRISIKHSLMQE
jgi:hypothetical protein